MSDGELVTIDGRAGLRFERRYRQPVERVWQAITAPDEMAQWFPARVEGSRTVGAALQFVDEAQRAAAIAAGEPTRAAGPEFRGTVLVHDPPHVFSFTWGGEILRYELHADRDGTRLVFTQVLGHRVTAARNGAGWHMCLAGLDRLLHEPTVIDAGGDDIGWENVFDRYVTRLGPPLGTPDEGGAMTWEVATHLDADALRAALAAPAAREVWGSGLLEWEIHPDPHGATVDVTHRAIGRDPKLAATWHARMVQLDMYLASGQRPAVDPARWVEPYRALLDAVQDDAARGVPDTNDALRSE